MKTIQLNTLESAKGIFPRANCFNVRLLKQGDGSGTIMLTVRWNQSEDYLYITGGVFIENGVEVTRIYRNNWGPECVVKVTSDMAYISVYRNIIGADGNYRLFSLAEALTYSERNSNSPIVDYTYQLYPLSSVNGMFRVYAGNTFNQPVSGIILPNKNYGSGGMTEMFTGCTKFNQSVKHFDTTFSDQFNLTFQNCYVFNQSVNHFNMSNANTCVSMFQGCASFNKPVDNWAMGNILAMSNMFQGCIMFNQDLSKWDYNLNVALDNFIAGCLSFSPDNYDKLLKKLNSYTWEGRTTPKILNADYVRYSKAGEMDRNGLIAKGWTIIDAGKLL